MLLQVSQSGRFVATFFKHTLFVYAEEGCGAAPAPPQFCAGSVQLPTGPPKARKSIAKLRKHTSAAKIAKPEAVRPVAQAPGRPDAMSMMQI